jgi:hypothetical protein
MKNQLSSGNITQESTACSRFQSADDEFQANVSESNQKISVCRDNYRQVGLDEIRESKQSRNQEEFRSQTHENSDKADTCKLF